MIALFVTPLLSDTIASVFGLPRWNEFEAGGGGWRRVGASARSTPKRPSVQADASVSGRGKSIFALERPAVPKSLPIPAELLKPAASIDELLALGDDDFVSAAYRSVLDRAVDGDGLRNYLAQVRRGVSKERILAELAASPEGRAKAVPLPGLPQLLAEHGPRPRCRLCRLLRRLVADAIEPLLQQLRILDNRLYRLERATATIKLTGPVAADGPHAAVVATNATPARPSVLAQTMALDGHGVGEIFADLTRRARGSAEAAQLRSSTHGPKH